MCTQAWKGVEDNVFLEWVVWLAVFYRIVHPARGPDPTVIIIKTMNTLRYSKQTHGKDYHQLRDGWGKNSSSFLIFDLIDMRYA